MSMTSIRRICSAFSSLRCSIVSPKRLQWGPSFSNGIAASNAVAARWRSITPYSALKYEVAERQRRVFAGRPVSDTTRHRLVRDLFQDWLVIVARGGKTNRLGALRSLCASSEAEDMKMIAALEKVRVRRGYVRVPS